MKIEHIALWVKDLEKMKAFYLNFFDLSANAKYYNAKKKFSSYFLSFENGARIELMHKAEIADLLNQDEEQLGFTHFAIAVGSIQNVDDLTLRIQKNGYTVLGKPRTTGDGYYESVIADPEGNRIELTV